MKRLRVHCTTILVALLIIAAAMKYAPAWLKTSSTVKTKSLNNYSKNLTVKAERCPGKQHVRYFLSSSTKWIIIDATNVQKEDFLKTQDVPGWTILAFGTNIRKYRNEQCQTCLFIETADEIEDQLPSIPVTNLKMGVYLLLTINGAEWIYLTSQVGNLQTQLDSFDFGSSSTGLLYGGQVPFDPDKHFGLKAMSDDFTARNRSSYYTLGEHITPSIQAKWTPSGHLVTQSGIYDRKSYCRFPRVIVPSKLYPISELSGSLIEHRSFWVLGSLIRESSFWVLWRTLLMQHLGEVIGIYPPSCADCCFSPKTIKSVPDVSKKVASLKCKEDISFYECGTFLAAELQKHDLLTKLDVKFVQIWFDALRKIKFKEPQAQRQEKAVDKLKPVHQVIYEQEISNFEMKNPYYETCGSNLHLNTSMAPVNDILLVVIFNYPTYYSNILYLDFMYRKYFTNILYCGSAIDNFKKFQAKYPNPVTFLEINEIYKGVHGYMCTSHAMEMGYNVKGYLQMSDDVLLNMWNIQDLPRDKIWFQSSIRKGRLSDPTVPNITPLMKSKTWWPWSNAGWGVTKLRKLWEHFGLLLETQEKTRIASFLGQLSRSFGKRDGAFYEASDIFYVPSKFQDDFVFFSKLCMHHKLFLEICIPTMLCGFDDIKNIVRLQGRYLWYQERNTTMMRKVFSIDKHFLHSFKLKSLKDDADAQDFFCKTYLANL